MLCIFIVCVGLDKREWKFKGIFETSVIVGYLLMHLVVGVAVLFSNSVNFLSFFLLYIYASIKHERKESDGQENYFELYQGCSYFLFNVKF